MTSQPSQEEIKELHNTEKEKMRKRLTEIGIVEEMGLQEMKDIIQVLNESEKMLENSNSKKPDLPPVEVISPPKSPLENSNETTKGSYANKVKNASSSENVTTTMITKEEKEDKSTTESKCRPSPTNNVRPKTVPIELSKKCLKRKKIEMNLLHAKVPENDQPLERPVCEIIKDCERPILWRDFDVLDEELIQNMSDYLQEVRDEWMNDNMQIADDSELQWGSPIKVGSRIFSTDKKSTTKVDAEPVKEGRNRASKRKASSLIANINNVSDSEPEADDDSALLKKRKPQQERRSPITSGSNVQMDLEIETEPLQTPSTSNIPLHTSNNKKLEFSEDEDIFDPVVNRSKSPDNMYPRLVPPIIPGVNKARRGRPRSGKANFKGPRAKKSNDNSKSDTLETSSSVQMAPAPEILIDSENDEEQDITPKTDPKMLKMSISEKTKLAKQKLEDMHAKEKERAEEKILNHQKIEEEKRKKQEEMVKKRLANVEEAKKVAKDKEEHESGMKKKWNDVINEKGRKREKRGLTGEEILKQLDEDDVVICEDLPPVPSSSSNSKNQVVCPICSKFFPESDILHHASECNLFEADVEERSSPVIGKRQRRNNKVEMHTCNICRNYETYDENEYLEHVQLCAEQCRSRVDEITSGSQGDFQSNFSSERKNLNLRRRPN